MIDKYATRVGGAANHRMALDGGRGTVNMVKAAKALGLPVWRPVDGEWRRDDGGS